MASIPKSIKLGIFYGLLYVASSFVFFGIGVTVGKQNPKHPDCPSEKGKQVATTHLLKNGEVVCSYISTYGFGVEKRRIK